MSTLLFDSLIFDLDGTLLDTGKSIITSIVAVLEERGARIPSDAELRSFVGPPLFASFERVCGFTGDDLKAVVARYREFYRGTYMYEAVPYEGMRETLEWACAQGIRVGVATNKLQSLTDLLIAHYGFDAYMSAVHGTDTAGTVSKADTIRACLTDWSVDRSRALMVGDSTSDSTAAAEVGVPFLGVTYGFGFADAAAVAQVPSVGSVDAPRQIIDVFEGRRPLLGGRA